MKLNLGSGYRYLSGYENIDSRQECNPDLICDITVGLPYDDNSVKKVRAFDFLEHIEQKHVINVIEEIYRVLEPNGIFEHFTPSTDGRGAFQDPTHVSFWNPNSWKYYTEAGYRNLYGIKAHFKILTMKEKYSEDKVIHVHGVLNAIK